MPLDELVLEQLKAADRLAEAVLKARIDERDGAIARALDAYIRAKQARHVAVPADDGGPAP